MSNKKLMCLLLLFVGLGLAACSAGNNQFVYSGFSGANLTLDGTARTLPGGLLELTNGMVRVKGHAFYPTPLQFHKSPNSTARSFSTAFVFGIVSAYPNLSGHGLAFVVAPSKDFSAAFPTQFLGLFNNQSNGNTSSHIFAVELDTIKNDEFQDIDNNHVGININNIHSMQSHHAGFYDDKDGILKNLTLVSHDREAMQVWVDYDGETTQINVTMAPLDIAKPVRPLLSTTYDLSSVLTDQAYIGFSSSTGMLTAKHYVLGWSFSMNNSAPAIDITKLPKLPRIGINKARTKVLAITLPIAIVVFFISVGTSVFLLVKRHLRYAELREDWEVEFGPNRFTYKDLFNATEGFKDKHLLGIGGFGRVYKGVLSWSKLEIAVKRVSYDSNQGMKEFIAEVVSIGRLQHRNIVQLLGYCRRKSELFLVYEYMSNGSLDKYLYDQEDRPTLDWTQRFQIIKDIAYALLYLHEEWEKVVLHRDIKTNNILLDNKMNGRLGDFSLARLYDHGTHLQTTHPIVGTIGYLAPELARTGKTTPLTDAFAFGIFILEVTCGLKPIKQNTQDNQLIVLADWVLEHWHKGSLTDTVDIKLQGNYNIDEVCLTLKLGLLCSHPFANTRPNMREVIQYLEGDMALPELIPTHLSFNMSALMQNEGFDSYIMSYPSSIASPSTIVTSQEKDD